jgi:hypothetical protein
MHIAKGHPAVPIERHASRRNCFLRLGMRNLPYLIQLHLLGFSSTYKVHNLGFAEYIRIFTGNERCKDICRLCSEYLVFITATLQA